MNIKRPASRWLVIGPFLFAVVLLAAVGVASVEILSSARAFVAGESLYSKGQKDAVHHLLRYAESRRLDDWSMFRESIALPVGDRIARESLDRLPPDLEAAYAGFLQGGNPPEDIPGLIRTFRAFRQVPAMSRAIETWSRGDVRVAELDRLAASIHAEIGRDGDATQLKTLVAAIGPLNDELTVLEREFSEQLRIAANLTQHVVLAFVIGTALVLAVVGVLLTQRLLRAQAAADGALRDSNERWERAAAAAEVGQFELDASHGRVRVDARAGELLGLTLNGPAVVQVPRAWDAIHPEDLAKARATLQAAEYRQPLELRVRVARAGGGWRHVAISTRRGRLDGSAADVMTGIVWDVSLDMQAEQLRLDKEAAERANRAKSEFLSRVSHELRTPLNAILGFAQLMQTDDRDPLSGNQRARMGHVLTSGRHLLGLINDVLDLTSIDQGAFTVSPSSNVDLVALLRDGVQRIEPIAQPMRVQIELELPEGKLMVVADPKRVDQIVGNLLSNAIKYNRPHGRVVVRLDAAATEWRLDVEDTGVGMAAVDVGRLFEPFNRLGAELTRVEGTGLGLVITRQLVQGMGGQISVRSAPGAGSTFTVRMPMPRLGPGDGVGDGGSGSTRPGGTGPDPVRVARSIAPTQRTAEISLPQTA